MQKKLLVVKNAEIANMVADFFPDFLVKGIGSALVGMGFDVIIVSVDLLNEESVTVKQHAQNYIEHLHCRLLGKDSKLIIL